MKGTSLLIAAFCVLLIGTAARAQTHDVHYRQGLRELEAGNLETALEEFHRARTANPKFAPAYVGLAMVAMEQGNFDDAHTTLKQAKKYDKNLVDTYVVWGQVYMREGAKDWEKKALKQLKEAEKIAPTDDRAPYYRGLVHKKARKFQDAVAAFGASAGLKGPMAKAAEAAQRHVQLVQRALPEVKKAGDLVALKDVATRADMALLFLDEFDLRAWMKKHRPEKADMSFKPYDPQAPPQKPEAAPDPPDIAKHPHRNLIRDVLAMEIPGLELYPDGGFGPDQPVSRIEFAQIMQGLLVLGAGDRSLATKYIGEKASRFPDLRADHFAYNAATLCVQRGILQPETDGKLLPDRPVSGAEAILGVKKALGL